MEFAHEPEHTKQEEEHARKYTLREARELINLQDRERESSLAQFQEAERITLSQRLTQARADQATILETKALDSEYN